MKYKVSSCALSLCCFLYGCAYTPKAADRASLSNRQTTKIRSSAVGTREYAYIGTPQGIIEYRVSSDGRLKPLTGRPVKGSPARPRFYLDPRTETVFAIDDLVGYVSHAEADNIYSYTVVSTGHLLPQTAKPTQVGLDVGVAALNPEYHFLYLKGYNYSDAEEELIVCDVEQPAQVLKQQTIVFPHDRYSAILGNIIPGQGGSSLYLTGRRDSWDGRRRWGELQEYHVDWRKSSPVSDIAHHQVDNPLLGGIRVGRRLVLGDWRNALYVCEIKDKRVNVLSTTPLSDTFTGDLPGGMAYRQAGSILYVGIQHGADSARVGPPPETVVAYHLSSDGQLHKLKTEANQHVGNPIPFLDNTGRFLYVVGEGNTIDTYKIAPDGRLSPAISRLKIDAPSGMVFIGGTRK